MDSLQEKKKAAGYKAAKLVKNHSVVGLGTGSTVYFFLEALGKECAKGLSIKGIPTSLQTAELAKNWKIPLASLEEVSHVDITVDGADEIDPKKRMIKGRGGALLREKLLAVISKELIIIVDDTKLVPKLGKGVLPVEVVMFGFSFTERKLKEAGYGGSFRLDPTGSLFITENGNLLYDIQFDATIDFPEEEQDALRKIIGVVETGFFLKFSPRIIVAYSPSKVETLT